MQKKQLKNWKVKQTIKKYIYLGSAANSTILIL
jgi:hypothetical protein